MRWVSDKYTKRIWIIRRIRPLKRKKTKKSSMKKQLKRRSMRRILEVYKLTFTTSVAFSLIIKKILRGSNWNTMKSWNWFQIITQGFLISSINGGTLLGNPCMKKLLLSINKAIASTINSWQKSGGKRKRLKDIHKKDLNYLNFSSMKGQSRAKLWKLSMPYFQIRTWKRTKKKSPNWPQFPKWQNTIILYFSKNLRAAVKIFWNTAEISYPSLKRRKLSNATLVCAMPLPFPKLIQSIIKELWQMSVYGNFSRI